MGFDATIKINGEIDSKFKTDLTEFNSNQKNRYRAMLLGTCMQYHEDLNMSKRQSLYDEIAVFVRLYVMEITDEWKFRLKETLKESNNEFYVRGWSFYNDRWIRTTIDELEAGLIQELFLNSLCANVSLLDNSEKWHDKKGRIFDIVDEIEENVFDIMDHEFYEEYKDKEENELNEDF